jgi:endonuclease YncB( thermonuclease family)
MHAKKGESLMRPPIGKLGLVPFFLVLFLTSTFAGLTLADSHTAQIVGIADGDSVTAVLSSGQSVNVRLEGIDAPEHGQAFASASEKHLSELVLGKVRAPETKSLTEAAG